MRSSELVYKFYSKPIDHIFIDAALSPVVHHQLSVFFFLDIQLFPRMVLVNWKLFDVLWHILALPEPEASDFQVRNIAENVVAAITLLSDIIQLGLVGEHPFNQRFSLEEDLPLSLCFIEDHIPERHIRLVSTFKEEIHCGRLVWRIDDLGLVAKQIKHQILFFFLFAHPLFLAGEIFSIILDELGLLRNCFEPPGNVPIRVPQLFF